MDLALSATIQHERRKIAWARSHLAGTEASIRRSNVSYSINIPNSVSAKKKKFVLDVNDDDPIKSHLLSFSPPAAPTPTRCDVYVTYFSLFGVSVTSTTLCLRL